MFSPQRWNLLLALILTFFVLLPVSRRTSAAEEPHPAVARLSYVSGPVSYSRGDDPNEWGEAIENVPLTIGDRLYVPNGGRAELQLALGNFIRLGPQSYLSILNMSEDVKQFYIGEGIVSLSIRKLGPDDVIEIGTPNVSVTLEGPGRYRIAVDDRGDSRISVQRGRVSIAAGGKQITVANSEVRVYGTDSLRYEVVGLPGADEFDRWAMDRDDRFERDYRGVSQYASEDIIGVEDLAQYGRWESLPEYGYAWTPASVAPGWVPFSVGRWFWRDPWGWNWISSERWGWATSHYGRWVFHRGRWYWVPARPRTRVRYIPACVGFVRVGDRIGWFPLHPRDRFFSWWERRDSRLTDQRIVYANRTHVIVVSRDIFISARPVHPHILRDPAMVREFVSARPAPGPFALPERVSLPTVSDAGERRHHAPPPRVLTRPAVLRVAPPAPTPTFEEKLLEIQKRQGRPIDPATAPSRASRHDRSRAWQTVIRPAAESAGIDFAPRTPQGAAGMEPEPITAARGRRLAIHEDAAATKATERGVPSESPVGPKAASDVPESTKEAVRAPQPDQKLQRAPHRQLTPQQRLEEMERRQAQREEERRALQDRQERERIELLRQHQLRERAQDQKLQELERRQQEQERALERQARLPQRQQEEQQRRAQLRHQQIQEPQALQPQKQQELERRQAERKAEHGQNQERLQRQRQEGRLPQLQKPQPRG